ncbi:hypothetical protein ACFMPD_15515 [Sedimentitalea sp. HM32M-2]|uniref:hypothetical protein n=1 Tax=Sedimentitalea sp. HM32M-2 TaxID=3351566 RepID=UPI0036340F69
MSRSLSLFGIGLVFGGGVGFLVAAANGVTLDGHDHADPAAHGAHGGHSAAAMTHDHGDAAAIDLPAGTNAPTVNIRVVQDPMSGWNLQVMTQNFRFAPDRASTGHVAGEGHAHVYLNGLKISRLYGDWLHIPALPRGDTQVTVSLNANDHSPLTVAGAPLSASTIVTVP